MTDMIAESLLLSWYTTILYDMEISKTIINYVNTINDAPPNNILKSVKSVF